MAAECKRQLAASRWAFRVLESKGRSRIRNDRPTLPLVAEIEGQICLINAVSGPSVSEVQRNPAPALDEMLAWLDDLRVRSEHLDDSTPARVWDLMLRALALHTALRSDHANPGFRETATTNLRRLVQKLKGVGL